MPIYRLEPVESLKDHNTWRMSGMGPMAVWVRAGDADDARQIMALATVNNPDDVEANELTSPWLNSTVVDCEEDNSRDVPEGQILLGTGEMIPL